MAPGGAPGGGGSIPMPAHFYAHLLQDHFAALIDNARVSWIPQMPPSRAPGVVAAFPCMHIYQTVNASTCVLSDIAGSRLGLEMAISSRLEPSQFISRLMSILSKDNSKHGSSEFT